MLNDVSVGDPVMVGAIIALAGVVLVLVRTVARWLRPSRRARLHRSKQQHARRVLDTIRSIERMPQSLAYLRKIDPLTFEELLLEAFERRGHKVHRNMRYTGDGGIDGAVIIDGVQHLIQAKRYQGAINPQHVRDFCHILDRRGYAGFFCHTGRTGPSAKALGRTHPRLTILSGQRLLDLLADDDAAFSTSRGRAA